MRIKLYFIKKFLWKCKEFINKKANFNQARYEFILNNFFLRIFIT